jgi:hypothetical protein
MWDDFGGTSKKILENTIKYAQEQKSEAQPCANYSGECI